MADLDHDPIHTKMLKAAVEFFANRTADLFRMGRCGDCPGCTSSVLNLGVYFTKCLGRALGLTVDIQLMVRPEAQSEKAPAPTDGGNAGMN